MWNGLWWIILAVVYFPESQTRDKGQEIRKVMKKVDVSSPISWYPVPAQLE